MAGPGSGDLKGALEACACLAATRLYMDWEPRLGSLFSVQIAALRRDGAVYRGRSLWPWSALWLLPADFGLAS